MNKGLSLNLDISANFPKSSEILYVLEFHRDMDSSLQGFLLAVQSLIVSQLDMSPTVIFGRGPPCGLG